jgi:hypothetical protein
MGPSLALTWTRCERPTSQNVYAGVLVRLAQEACTRKAGSAANERRPSKLLRTRYFCRVVLELQSALLRISRSTAMLAARTTCGRGRKWRNPFRRLRSLCPSHGRGFGKIRFDAGSSPSHQHRVRLVMQSTILRRNGKAGSVASESTIQFIMGHSGRLVHRL